MLPRARLTRLLGAALAPVLVLTACSGEDAEPAADPTEGTSSSAAEEPYLPVPDGVELTAQGSELALGDTATVAYQPRQDEVAALELTVTSLQEASFKLFEGWDLSAKDKKNAPYFIEVKAENVGETDLGGNDVPIYAVDGENRLVEASSFASRFNPCPSTPFPKKFGPGKSHKTCLVYLVPDKGELVAASFRPTEEFNPVVWTGELTEAELPKEPKKRKKKAGDKNG